MKYSTSHHKQKGVTLVIAILFLLILTIISVFAATSSSLELKMAGNMQNSYSSFQAAEAGTTATLALAGHATQDPFDTIKTGASTKIANNYVLSTGLDIKCDEDGTPQDTDGMDVFSRIWADDDNAHPLKDVYGGPSNISVCKTILTDAPIGCPFTEEASSGFFACDYYDIRSSHSETQKGQSTVHLGVIKTVLNKDFNG